MECGIANARLEEEKANSKKARVVSEKEIAGLRALLSKHGVQEE